MSQLDRYMKKLKKAEQKINILEEMMETRTRELYIINLNLERTNRELQQKNRELEQFTYIATHDLQEPLITITSHLSLLSQEIEHKLSEEEKTSVGFIIDASSRMTQLVRDLMAYGLIGHRRELTTVDCNALVEEVREDLSHAISETGAVITTEKLPTLVGQKIELKSLFQNLISNGIKFSRPETKPRIEISANKEENRYTFAVSDNGIGIAENQKERIFRVFNRLHARSKYQGTGIGLAQCNKIVQLHGGEIWVESRPEEGSTFYFTIKSLK